MKKTLFVVVMLVVSIVFTQSNVMAVDGTEYRIKIYLDGEEIVMDDSLGVPFIDENNRTQIPLRGVLEAFGAEVSWDAINHTVIVQKDDDLVKIPVGEKVITKNSEMVIMDTVAVLIDDRTYIPVRILEVMDAKIEWESETKSIYIESPPKPLVINRLPIDYDMRLRDHLTTIRDQGNLGTCWAFATMGAIESCLLPNRSYDFSEDHMSLSHGYNLTQNEGGDFQLSLAYLSRWSGPVYEEQDPYGDGVFTEGLTAAIHVQEAMFLPKKNYTAIKRAIMEYGGVQTSIHIRDIVEQELGEAYNEETYSFYYTGKELPNHDVVIVGWNDNYDVSNFKVEPKRPGAFICRNSYGTQFGDEGYFYVSYEDVLIGSENVVYTRLEPKDNYDKIYQSDWLGWVGRIGFGSDTAYFSNVYTTEGKEKLEAVSFYTTDMDTSYEVYVVDRFSGKTDFSNMKLVEKGFKSYSGYYTVDLEVPITVDGDFAVVVKVTTPGSTLPVAAEYYRDVKWLRDVTIEDGRGFMSADGKHWESTEEVLQSNVCLKAFTKSLQVIVEEEAPDVQEKAPDARIIEETEEIQETEETESTEETQDVQSAPEVQDTKDSQEQVDGSLTPDTEGETPTSETKSEDQVQE